MLTLSLALSLSLGNMAPPPKPPPTAQQAAPAKPAAAVTFAEGLSTPESVLYDAETDTYLVSNINGSPFGKDNNGYVAELSPEGKVVSPKLVEGGKNGATLNAPKGLALMAGVLYVADLDTVRLFDRKSGAPKGEVKIPGGTFVNDVFAADGKVYVTDSGFKQGKEGGFDPSSSDAVYALDTAGKKPKLKALVKSKDLKHPNGLWATKDTLYVVTFGSNELMTLGLDGKQKAEPTKLPKGSLDGVVLVGDELFVSSWEGKAVYRGKPGGEFKELKGELEAPADIGFDSKRGRVLVPHFMGNSVAAWDVK